MHSDSEKEMSHNDSLQLIEQMIGAAKDQHNERGEGWIIWGWILFLASTSSVVCMYLNMGSYVNWIWTAVLPVGVITYFLTRKKGEGKKVETYISSLLNRIETGFFISLVVMVIGSNIIGNYQHQYAHFLFGFYFVLYAFWMYIHGSATTFRPLIFGAFFNWIAALGIFFLTDFKYIMMVSAVATLVGYIIPGYIQRQQYKKSVTLK
jgi:MFS family permease